VKEGEEMAVEMGAPGAKNNEQHRIATQGRGSYVETSTKIVSKA
jgi:hypothetical protein